MSKVFIGIISYLGKDVPFRDSRIQMHQKQLKDIAEDFKYMQSVCSETAVPIVRIEQEWDEEVHEQIKSYEDGLNIESVVTERLNPGAARNMLLKRLYESDNDWLICSDDDHWLYPKYRGVELIWDLNKGTDGYTNQMLKQGIGFSAFPAYWEGYQKDVNAWGKSATHWLFTKTKHPGAMPLCAIPNIKKYFGIELYFNENTDCYSYQAPPEDLQFYIDWLNHGFKWMDSMCMIAKSEGNLDHSSLFESREYRKNRDANVKIWRNNYLKNLFPKKPELWKFSEFNKRRNNIKMIEIKRFMYNKKGE